jgi:hypothetical protein
LNRNKKFQKNLDFLFYLCHYIDMASLEEHYPTRLQGIRREGSPGAAASGVG